MNILYEDKDILVVEKPAGIPVETSRIGSKDMVSLLKNHLAETGGKPGGIPYLGMIHRLDQPVQGVMVFAKNQKAAASLSKEIAQNEMKKTYLAVVEGTAKEEESLTDYLLKDGRTNTSKKVPKGTKGAKESPPYPSPSSGFIFSPAAITRSASRWQTSASPSTATENTIPLPKGPLWPSVPSSSPFDIRQLEKA